MEAEAAGHRTQGCTARGPTPQHWAGCRPRQRRHRSSWREQRRAVAERRCRWRQWRGRGAVSAVPSPRLTHTVFIHLSIPLPKHPEGDDVLHLLCTIGVGCERGVSGGELLSSSPVSRRSPRIVRSVSAQQSLSVSTRGDRPPKARSPLAPCCPRASVSHQPSATLHLTISQQRPLCPPLSTPLHPSSPLPPSPVPPPACPFHSPCPLEHHGSIRQAADGE